MKKEAFKPTSAASVGFFMPGASLAARESGNFDRAGHQESPLSSGNESQLSDTNVTGKLQTGPFFAWVFRRRDEKNGNTNYYALARCESGGRLHRENIEDRLQNDATDGSGREDSRGSRREDVSVSLGRLGRLALSQRKGGQTMKKIYLVQGCGVSLICEQGQVMLNWITYMIERGCAPTVQLWAGSHV